MKVFLDYFLLFFIYSVLGWFIEIIAVFIEQKKIVNRGFYIGPYLPIYGTGAIVIVLYLSQYKSNPVTVFLLAFIICSFIEYMTSYIMEKIFKARWWDYSHLKYNINGRICLQNACLFGLLGLLLIYFINPFILKIIALIPENVLLVISIILLVLFILDVIISFKVTGKLKNTFNYVYSKKDSTIEIKDSVIKFLKENNKHLQFRILKSFPNIKMFNLKNKK